MSTTLTVALVRGDDGSIDESASLDAFQDALATHIAERELEQGTISKAVSAVFDSHKGTRCNMPYVVSQALVALNAQPANYKVLTERVQAYIRENAGEERSSGKLFKIGKGKGGGVTRWSDTPEKPAAETK